MTLDEKFDLLEGRLDAFMVSVGSYMDQQVSMLAALPLDDDGRPDAKGHRHYHEALITGAQKRAEFWSKMNFELAKYGLIAFLCWLAAQAWVAFLHGPKP